MHSYAKFPRLLLWLLLTTPALAAERELSVGPLEQTPVILSPYLEILEDPSRTLSLRCKSQHSPRALKAIPAPPQA